MNHGKFEIRERKRAKNTAKPWLCRSLFSVTKLRISVFGTLPYTTLVMSRNYPAICLALAKKRKK